LESWGLKAIAAVSFLLESLVRTISRGTPGFTRTALIYSVPRSIPRTPDAAKAVDVKRAIEQSSRRSN
jgi:hypothetical protein